MSVLKRSIDKIRQRGASFRRQPDQIVSQNRGVSVNDGVSQGSLDTTHTQAAASNHPATIGMCCSIGAAHAEPDGSIVPSPHNAAAEDVLIRREEAVKRARASGLTPANNKASDSKEYWGPVKDLTEEKLDRLLQHVITPKPVSHFKLINRLSGAFNVAYIMQSSQGQKLCVRVPACGWSARWNGVDADLLRATALGMNYIEKTSSLPIPRILGYDATMENDLGAPYTIMTFLEGTSLTTLWEQQDERSDILETRRQNILKSLAHIMCTLSTTTFRSAGTLWFPGDDDCQPVVGRSYRLDTRNIFMLRRKFLSFDSKSSVAEQVLQGRDERFAADGFPDRCATNVQRGVLALWGLMIDAFLQSATLDEGCPEFVLMQSDFNTQNILADIDGHVTGIIDWDCLESIPRQIGWCSVPHWLQADWYPDWKWPPDLGTEKTANPDEFERYRVDYARYMREACPDGVDVRFTSKSHIYQALLDSSKHYGKVENFVYNVIADILPRNSYPRGHVGSIGEYGFRKGEREWFETRLLQYFAPEHDNKSVEV